MQPVENGLGALCGGNVHGGAVVNGLGALCGGRVRWDA